MFGLQKGCVSRENYHRYNFPDDVDAKTLSSHRLTLLKQLVAALSVWRHKPWKMIHLQFCNRFIWITITEVTSDTYNLLRICLYSVLGNLSAETKRKIFSRKKWIKTIFDKEDEKDALFDNI